MIEFSPDHYQVPSNKRHLSDVRRILVMCGRGIGDVLLTLPAVSCLKRTYPDSHITAFCSPLSAQVLFGNEILDRIVPFDTKCSQRKWKDLTSVLLLLLSKRFDLYVSFGNRFPSWLFCLLARARYKVGRSNRKCELIYNIVDKEVFPKNTIHEVERNLRLASMVAEVSDFRLPFITIFEEERQWVREFVHSLVPGRDRKLVCIHVGGAFGYKRWPVEKFAEIARRLSSLPGIQLLMLYGPEEEHLARYFECCTQSKVHQYCPETVRQLITIIDAAELLICNDSGPMHIAAAVGTPLVAVFGGTDHKRWGPVSERAVVVRQEMDCWPCDAYFCTRGVVCIKDLPVEMVWEAVETILPELRSAKRGEGRNPRR